jgi:hypothetical protein
MFVQHTVSNTFTDRAASSNCFIIIIVIATRTHTRTRSTFIVFKRKRRNLAPNGRWVLPNSHLTPQISLTRCKILRLETDGFTSPPKEVVLRISMAIKIHRRRPGLNPPILGPLASTLTITLPRVIPFYYFPSLSFIVQNLHGNSRIQSRAEFPRRCSS